MGQRRRVISLLCMAALVVSLLLGCGEKVRNVPAEAETEILL